MTFVDRFASDRRLRVGAFVALVSAGLLIGGSPASSDHVAPEFVPGNPDCQDLGYDFGFKPQPEPPPTGTYFFGDAVTVPAHALTGDSVDIVSDGTFFDWTSTLGLDAVIVKGGSNANVYLYDPPAEEFSDTGLSAPINPNNNQPFAISHIELCYDFEVDVTKTADTSFTRTWTWAIDKTADQTDLVLSPGQSFTVDYWVDLVANSADSDWAVDGEIWIANNTPLPATVEGVDDVVSPGIPVAVNCGGPFPHVLAPGDDLHCTYQTPLPAGSNRTNTATVETSGQVGGGEATADVEFGTATINHVDEEVSVGDSLVGPLGTVAAPGGSYHYPYTIQATACGDQPVHNTATFVTNDTGTQGGDTWWIDVFVPCDQGCTLTQGYWKTHSEYGPAPHDDTWGLLPDGADTPFFGSGQSWYEVLWTAPKGGNAWYILAHQYIATELNVLNGATVPPDVATALADAEALLVQYEQNAKIPKRGSDRELALSLHQVLVDYNEGAIGPGHCDDDSIGQP